MQGESLQKQAEAAVAAARDAPLSPHLLSAEAAAQATAVALLRESLEAYSHVRCDGPGTALREDAAANSGHVLAAWAALEPDPAAAGALLVRACDAYEAAVAVADPGSAADMDTARAWADCTVRQAELCAVSNPRHAAALYDRALTAYAAAAAGVGEGAGEDVSGLLHDWGCGLHSQATHLGGPAATTLLADAAGRLRAAAAAAPGDAAPLNALGDVLQAAGEAQAGQAAELYRQALEEGYQRALRFSRGDADALVGCAEARLALARLAAASGDGASARALAAESADSYAAALGHTAALGTVAERLDVLYNAACACAAAGRLEAGRQALQQAMACGGTTEAEALADADLVALRV